MEQELMERILKLDNQLCFRLYRVSRNMTRFYQPYLKKYGLTYPQYIVLLALFEALEMDFKKLSERVDLRKATLTPIINKLEKLGYIFKRHNNIDKRRFSVVLTEKGKKLKYKIINVPVSMYGTLNIEHESYKKLVEELDSLLEILKENQ